MKPHVFKMGRFWFAVYGTNIQRSNTWFGAMNYVLGGGMLAAVSK